MNIKYNVPTNRNEWWKIYNDNKDVIYPIIFSVINPNHISYEIPGNSESKETGRTIVQDIEYLEKMKDKRLSDYLEATWNLTSDVKAGEYISKGNKGWFIICDLCSEKEVLFYNENQS